MKVQVSTWLAGVIVENLHVAAQPCTTSQPRASKVVISSMKAKNVNANNAVHRLFAFAHGVCCGSCGIMHAK